MSLNFNQYPYNDDFSQTKNFHRILFKPGVSVQARELTQAQTILQDQITKFGNHIFKNHTIVSGGRISINQQVSFLKLESVDQNNNDLVVSNFLNKTVKNSTGTVVAKVVNVAEAITDEKLTLLEPPTLILSYLSDKTFNSGDIVYADSETLTAEVIRADSSYQPASGKSSIASIDEGVFYVDGYFVYVSKQTETIEEYTNTPTARIGLSIEQTIVNSDQDFSLLDPALGESNYQAPGADRYKIFLRLVVKPLTLDEDSTFIELCRIQDGVIQKAVVDTEYSELDNYFAKRTFDTNGDFIVNRFKITTEATGNTNSSTFKIKVGPGKAFVQGYYVENTGELSFISNKARANSSAIDKLITMNYGNYLNVDNLVGEFDFNNYQTVDIHCVKNANTTNNSVYNSTIAGTAKIRNLDFVIAANTANSKTYTYQAYLIDVQTETKTETANAVTSITANTITLPVTYSRTNDAYKGIYLRINNGINYGDVVQIDSYNGTTRVATLSRNFIRTPTETNLSYSLLFNTKDFESLYKGFSSANNTAKISNYSKTNQLDSGDVYFSNIGDEELIYELGNPYVVRDSIVDSEYYSWMKFTNTSLASSFTVPNATVAVFDAADGTLSESNAKEKFICVITDKGSSSYNVGDIIPFSGSTTVSISSSSSVAQINDSALPGVYANIYAKVYVKNGNEINYSKRTKNLVTCNVSVIGTFNATTLVSGLSSTYVDSANSQVFIAASEFDASNTKQSLYISDVKNIIKIIDTKGSSATLAMLSDPNYDITNNFVFDNGQNDFYYDHAKIKLLPGKPVPKGNVLVLCNYYEHAGNGYFDLGSYFINNGSEQEPYLNFQTYISKRGKVYNLRDCLDFRKTRTNKATTFSLQSYSAKPTGIPIDGTNFKTSYSAYYGRKDIVVATKNKKFTLIEGVPAETPKEPNRPEGSMVLARIIHDPYTLRLPGEVFDPRYSSVRIENIAHKRWRMEDITNLEERVSRVEYYTVLNSLEQSAQTLQIPDELGINRFKNGILTDDFSSFNVSDTTSRDLKCSILAPQKKLFSTHNVQNFDLTLRDNLYAQGRLDSSSKASLGYNIDYDGNIGYVTLPYTKTPAAVQPYATRTVNINPFGIISKEGTLKINPFMDQWVSSTREPDRLINITIPLTEKLVSTGQWQTISTAEVKRTRNPSISVKKGITYTSGEVSKFDEFTTQQLKDFVSVWNVNTEFSAETQRSNLIAFLQKNYSNKGIQYSSSSSETVTIRNNLERKLEFEKVPVDFDDENYTAENGYITNVAIDPYIRAQQIEFTADRLLFNCSLQFFFDGVAINDRIRESNEIVVSTGTTSEFSYGDVLAYYEGGSFIKFGKILSSHTISTDYSSGSKTVKLKIIGDIESRKYTGGIANPYQADIFSVETNSSGTVTNILTKANILNYNIKSGKVLQKLSSNTIAIRSMFEGHSNTLNYFGRKIINIMTDEYTQKYSIDRAESGANNSIILYCNTNIVVSNTINNSTYNIQDGEDFIQTDENGSVSGVFYLPKDKFNTGEKVFRIDNRILYNRGSETTFAETKFFASSLSQKTQFLNFSADTSGAGGRFYKSESRYEDNDVVFPGESTSTQTPVGEPAPPPSCATNVNGAKIKWMGTSLEHNPSVPNVNGFYDALFVMDKWGITNKQVVAMANGLKARIPTDWPEASGGAYDIPINVDNLDYTNLETIALIVTTSEQFNIRNSTIDAIVSGIFNQVDVRWVGKLPTGPGGSTQDFSIKYFINAQYLRFLAFSTLGQTGSSSAPDPNKISNSNLKITNNSVSLNLVFYDTQGVLQVKPISFSFDLRNNIDRNFPSAIKRASGSNLIDQKSVIKDRISPQYMRYMMFARQGHDGLGQSISDPFFRQNSVTITKISESDSATEYKIDATFAYLAKADSSQTVRSVSFTDIFPKDKNVYSVNNFYAGAWYWYINDNEVLQKMIKYGADFGIPREIFTEAFSSLINYNLGTPKHIELVGFVYGCEPPISVDPVSQTFLFFAEEYPNGCFIKSIKVFFRTKPTNTNSPVSCYLLGTQTGIPSGEYLPHGISTLSPDQVKISDSPNVNDANTYTEFVFTVPVYVKPETLYAFMIKSDSTEYTAYTANLGEFAIPSTTKNNPSDPEPTTLVKVSATPYVGELFLSQNTLTWAPDQNQDMMFEINRCEFNINNKPTIEFIIPNNLPQRRVVDNIFGFLEDPDGTVDSNVSYLTRENYRLSAINISTTDLTFVSAPILYQYKATVYNNGSPYLEDYFHTINPGKYGTATLEDITFDDNKGERVLLANSINSFSLYAIMSSIDSAISPMISESGVTLYGIQWNINNLGITANNINILQQGTGFSNGQIITVRRTSNTTSNTVVSDAVLTAVTGANGNIVSVNVVEPGSHYATNPILTITGGTANAVIEFAGETGARDGNSVYRYITKPVTLAAGFDAGDLRIYYTAYRPINTNFYVYYKILNRNDTQTFNDSDWQIMTTISGSTTFSSSKDQLFEFVAAPYIEPEIGIASNKVSYVSKASGQTYTEFYQFAIKVVAASNDSTAIPYLKDIRGIALPSGE